MPNALSSLKPKQQLIKYTHVYNWYSWNKKQNEA